MLQTEGSGCYTSKHIHHYTLLRGWLYLRKWDCDCFRKCDVRSFMEVEV